MTSCWFIAGLTHGDKQPSTLTVTPMVNLESPINLVCMFLDSGRKPEYPESTKRGTFTQENDVSTFPMPFLMIRDRL